MKKLILGSLLVVLLSAGCTKINEPMETLVEYEATEVQVSDVLPTRPEPKKHVRVTPSEDTSNLVYSSLIQEHFRSNYQNDVDDWEVVVWRVDDHVNAIGIHAVKEAWGNPPIDYDYDYLCWNGNEYESHTGSLFSELGVLELVPEYGSLNMCAGIKGDKLCFVVNAVGNMAVEPITRYIDLSSFGGCTMEYSNDVSVLYTVDATATSFTSHSDPILDWSGSLSYNQDGKTIHISCSGVGEYFSSEWIKSEELNGLRLLDATYEEKESRDKTSSTKRIIHGTQDDLEYEKDRFYLDGERLNLFKDYSDDSYLDK